MSKPGQLVLVALRKMIASGEYKAYDPNQLIVQPIDAQVVPIMDDPA